MSKTNKLKKIINLTTNERNENTVFPRKNIMYF